MDKYNSKSMKITFASIIISAFELYSRPFSEKIKTEQILCFRDLFFPYSYLRHGLKNNFSG